MDDSKEIEIKRLERLRNLLTPMHNLAQMVANDDGSDKYIPVCRGCYLAVNS